MSDLYLIKLHPSVKKKKLDVVAVMETWLSTKETSASLADVTPNGFKLVQKKGWRGNYGKRAF